MQIVVSQYGQQTKHYKMRIFLILQMVELSINKVVNNEKWKMNEMTMGVPNRYVQYHSGPYKCQGVSEAFSFCSCRPEMEYGVSTVRPLSSVKLWNFSLGSPDSPLAIHWQISNWAHGLSCFSCLPFLFPLQGLLQPASSPVPDACGFLPESWHREEVGTVLSQP